jgi:hypothetical protein
MASSAFGFIRYMDIHAYLFKIMPMAIFVIIGMIETLVKLWWLHWRIVGFVIDFHSTIIITLIAHSFTIVHWSNQLM